MNSTLFVAYEKNDPQNIYTRESQQIITQVAKCTIDKGLKKTIIQHPIPFRGIVITNHELTSVGVLGGFSFLAIFSQDSQSILKVAYIKFMLLGLPPRRKSKSRWAMKDIEKMIQTSPSVN